MLFILAVLAAFIATLVYFSAKKRFNKSESTFAFIGLLVAIIIAVMQFWTIIPAGHVGVVDFLGSVSDNTLKPGINLVNPMATVVKFDARTDRKSTRLNSSH